MIKAPLAVLGAAIAAASLALTRGGGATTGRLSASPSKASEAEGGRQNAQLVPGSEERFREVEALDRQARKAEARGDLEEAERL